MKITAIHFTILPTKNEMSECLIFQINNNITTNKINAQQKGSSINKRRHRI